MDEKKYLTAGKKNEGPFTPGGEDIPLELFISNRFQPRKLFDKEALENLAASIQAKGILQAITARQIKDPEKGDIFEIAMGERRWRAAGIAGLKTIRTVVKEISDRDMAVIGLVENLQRENLCFIETMESYALLRDSYEGDMEAVMRDVGQGRGKSRRSVERHLKIHGDIHSIPEIAEIFLSQKEMPTIDLSTAESVSSITSTLKKLQKSNRREFDAIIKNLHKKGVKDYIPKLVKKFKGSNGNGKAEEGKGNKFITETEREIAITIRVRKSREAATGILPDAVQACDAFKKMLEELSDGGDNETKGN